MGNVMDRIVSKPTNQNYRDNYENTFNSKKDNSQPIKTDTTDKGEDYGSEEKES